jgi:hypothetical protein
MRGNCKYIWMRNTKCCSIPTCALISKPIAARIRDGIVTCTQKVADALCMNANGISGEGSFDLRVIRGYKKNNK